MTWFWSLIDGDEPGEIMATFRICVGLTLAWTFFNGLTTEAWLGLHTGLSHGGLAPDGTQLWWLEAAGGKTPGNVWWLTVTGVASSLALALGVGWRVTPLVTIWVSLALFGLHPGSGGGHDRLLTNALWVLVLADSTATWSLDARLWRGGRWSSGARIPSWPRRLAIYQLVLMYTITGLEKQGSAWGPSTGYAAVYRTLLLPTWVRFDFTWLAHVYPLTQIGTFVAWWWELTWFVLGLNLVARTAGAPRWLGWLGRIDLRPIYVGIGVILHGSLWVTMALGPFSPATFAYYVCLISPREAERGLSRWRATS
ncbi:MAG: hypothetical protein ACON5B_05145 [Myxococcota bacterium]